MNLTDEENWFEKNVEKVHVHGKNILAKLKNYSKLKNTQKKNLKN